ncbi:RluA family pseudouridine synthase [Christensenellaceae bacterium OttesenSCG-928-K19]|nr:RluA family pseudouridine synthase [Christensenellaceae bacterium OttesenSCG-928-K19]
MSSRRTEFIINENTGKRLDAYLAGELKEHTRSFIKTLITQGMVLVNGKQVKAGYMLKTGDTVIVDIPQAEQTGLQAQDIPLDIVYEDEDIIVINKPQGMVVHPAAGNPDGTLVNALLFHCRDLSGIGGELRPGIVHRLDKDTSGVIVAAKNDVAHLSLSNQLKDRSIKKTYIALCHGNVKEDTGTIRTNIDRHPKDRKKMAVSRMGREAVSHYEVLKRYGQYTLLAVEIETGRTHQIRVHMKHMGHPVVGDALYTKLRNPFGVDGQLLHAEKLRLRHPTTGQEMEFSAPLPQYFEKVLDTLKEI